jgi:hypothetical protein
MFEISMLHAKVIKSLQFYYVFRRNKIISYQQSQNILIFQTEIAGNICILIFLFSGELQRCYTPGRFFLQNWVNRVFGFGQKVSHLNKINAATNSANKTLKLLSRPISATRTHTLQRRRPVGVSRAHTHNALSMSVVCLVQKYQQTEQDSQRTGAAI